tara:strand:- start:18428 stop:19108 length:681 start_codon:yes stop_codon:yes gene_type:complete
MSEENDKIKMATDSEQRISKDVSTEALVAQSDKQSADSSELQDDTWAELTQDWQTQPTVKTDVLALVKRTRRRTIGAKFCFALNIVATIALFIAFIYGIYNGEWGKPLNIYLGLGSLLSLIFVYFETKVRVATWSQLCDSPEKAIDNAIASSKSSMQYMWITKISFLPFLPLINWFVYTSSQTNSKAVLPAYLMANGFMVIVYILVDYLHRQRKQEYQQLLKVKSL